MKEDLAKLIGFTKKRAPEYTIPVTSERIFAELKHKTIVPAPTTYFFMESATKSTNADGVVEGTAFGSRVNSQHTFHGASSMHPSPSRFDTYQDGKDAMRPSPATYKAKDYHRKKILAQVRAENTRFPRNEYLTDAPGPGSYRHQSNFGIYSASDSHNRVNSDLLTKITS